MNGDLLTNSMCVREYDFQVPYTIDRRKIFCKCRNQFYEKLISENKKVKEIQEVLKKHGYLVGAIRQPTVKEAIIRLIAKIDIENDVLTKICKLLKDLNVNK